MKPILLGVLVGALAFGAGAVGAKIENVTNPMHDDLNAAGWNINNAGSIEANSVVTPSVFVHPRTDIVLLGGNDNPSLTPVIAPVDDGSLYLSPTGIWVKHGIGTLDWTCIAMCAP